MNVTVTIDHEKRTNFVKWEGRVTADNILQAMMALHEDPQFDPSYDTLCDYTQVHEMVMTAADMERLLRVMDKHDMRCGRTAMVMPTDRAQQNVGKVMSKALAAKGSDVHLMCTSHLEAEVWLGLRKLMP